jgi:amino acid adenylation domain-containing protein
MLATAEEKRAGKYRKSGNLSNEIYQKIVTEWNQTVADFPDDVCLHQLIDAQAERHPDSIAVVFENQHITYAELVKRANQLANYLVKLGVGPDALVGLCHERSLDMLIGALGIQKAGGAYVPLDPSFPPGRIALVLEDANARLLVTEQKQLPLLNTAAQAVCLDSDWTKISEEKSTAPDSGIKQNNLAYVIYTSGSTGKPKGVQIEHHSVVNFLNSMRKKPGFQREDILLAVTTLAFDISILELYLPLTTGAKVVILADDKTSDGSALIKAIEEEHITVMQATPASWRLLLESGWQGSPDLRVLCGGEALPTDLARELLPRCKELWNMYGPTETTIWSTCSKITDAGSINIGHPIDNTEIYVLDTSLQPLSVGMEGELMIGGEGVARGYLNRPVLTNEKFIPNPFKDGRRIYRTGDLARYLEDGSIECLGRIDDQVKLHGFRIELGEIETALSEIDGIGRAVVVLREDKPGHPRLAAYYMGPQEQAPDILRQSLLSKLPEYMVPSVYMRLQNFPLTPNGKLDRKALPAPKHKRPSLAKDYIAPQSELEKKLVQLWSHVLDIEEVGIDDSFFDLGGTSLLAARMVTRWQKLDERQIPLVKVFQYPTIALLSAWLSQKDAKEKILYESELRTTKFKNTNKKGQAQTPVAIIGMAGRFPGADNLELLWDNLCNSVESISVFKREELGIGIEEWLRNDPDYVPARGILEGAELFDATFFGISPLEAAVMDPQQRVFLELAQEVLENAGYDPDRYLEPIGVYAGVGDNHYYSINLLSNPNIIAQAGKLAVEYGNEKDYIALRVAYALGLAGPAISVNTACSTSLVAVDNAVQGLANYDCDLALAGGIDICIPQKSGFLYIEGGTFSKDGHCKPFDAEATGTMFCDGAGIIALKRLDDALADRDTIYAVIRGSAKNNNGSRTASFLAPSVDGQAEVIAMAQARAGIPIETIGYIEAHGTGTPVGDPIEVEALSKVFVAKTEKKQFCYIGSIKGHIGHPTNAAGVAGIIKAALVLHKEEIPPNLHFKNPNPRIDFANSPFKVVDKLVPFKRGEIPRRTAVSSFGFGGTNVHAILEEAPLPLPSGQSRPLQLIIVSAKTASALEAYSRRLADHFAHSSTADFPDEAHTLIQGRKQFPHRKVLVASNPSDAAKLLEKPTPARCANCHCSHRNPPVTFLFGGQGTQYLYMGLNLYQGEPLFRTVVDECCELLRPHLDQDLHSILYPHPDEQEKARESLQNTCFTQPATFTIQYAMARLWQSLGVEPAMMAGHSIGEFVAATLAGVFELPGALNIVALRGRLMQSMHKGSMLSVRAPAEEVADLLPPSIQLAAVNAPSLCVTSGPTEEILALQKTLEGREIACRILQTSHAFHSAMMEPILEPLRQEFKRLNLNPPSKPFVSTVTGLPITDMQACDSEYWVMHARKTVQFSSAISWLLGNGHHLFLECGARATMCTLARQHLSSDKPVTAIPSMGDTHENSSEWEALLMAVGSLWLQGVAIDWDAFYAHEQRRRVPLPTYPFERQRHWVDPIQVDTALTKGTTKLPPRVPVPIQASEARLTEATPSFQATAAAATRKDRLQGQLVEILAHVWGRDASLLSSSATFLEQGFDSLSLTQAAIGIRQKFGVKVNFSQLMREYPNLDLMTAFLEENTSQDILPEMISPPAQEGPVSTDNVTTSAHDIARLESKIEELSSQISRLTALLCNVNLRPAQYGLESEGQLKSTIPQRGIFFSSRLSDNLSASYNESVTIRVEGIIDSQKLKNTIEKILERHDALHASFDETGMLMKIAPVVPLNIEEHDFAHLNLEAKEEALRKLLLEETAVPFSLPKGPLFRSKIVFLDAEAAAIVMTGHHTICDGWSLDVLIRDFCTLYSEQISGKGQHLQREGSSYADYVRMVARREDQEEFKTARKFWETKFAKGFPALVLPSNKHPIGRRKFTAKRKEARIDAETTRLLREIAAKQGWSFFALVLGAYSLLLARISRQHHFVIALPTAEQPIIGQPDLVGHCVNMIPFEVHIRAGESVEEFLAEVQEELAASYNHAAYTTAHIIERLRPAGRSSGITPISAGITSVKKYLTSELPQEGFKVRYDINAKSFESFEWYVTALEAGDELILRVNFDTGLFNDFTADGWLEDFLRILANIAARPSRDLFEIAEIDSESAKSAPEALFIFTEDNISARSQKYSNAPSRANTSTPVPRKSASTVSEAEAKVITIWQDHLKIRDIGPTDNFFDLGGNSMAAAQIFAAIERELSVSLPLSLLFESTTPRDLAQKIQGRTIQENWRSTVPINVKGTRRPLFLIHGAEGNVLIYRSLSLHLGEDQPVYGLQAAGLDGSELEKVDFEKVAYHYIKEIQKVQQRGPYLLGGYCLGGTIALEMAHQLQTMGDSAGLVAMFENYNIKAIQWPQPTAVKLCNSVLNVHYHMLNLMAARGDRWTFFNEKLKVEMMRARISSRAAWAKTIHRLGGGTNNLHHLKVGKAFDEALTRYEVKPYRGRVALFLACKALMGFNAPKGGWGDVIEEGLEVYTMPINPRGSMVEPHVRNLATKLRILLDETRA